jgi:hypothetical protein
MTRKKCQDKETKHTNPHPIMGLFEEQTWAILA